MKKNSAERREQRQWYKERWPKELILTQRRLARERRSTALKRVDVHDAVLFSIDLRMLSECIVHRAKKK